MPQKLDKKLVEEKKFAMDLSIYEVNLILELRKFEFGSFEVYKTNGQPARISRKEFKLLKPEEIIGKLDLAKGIVK